MRGNFNIGPLETPASIYTDRDSKREPVGSAVKTRQAGGRSSRSTKLIHCIVFTLLGTTYMSIDIIKINKMSVKL